MAIFMFGCLVVGVQCLVHLSGEDVDGVQPGFNEGWPVGDRKLGEVREGLAVDEAVCGFGDVGFGGAGVGFGGAVRPEGGGWFAGRGLLKPGGRGRGGDRCARQHGYALRLLHVGRLDGRTLRECHMAKRKPGLAVRGEYMEVE